MPETPLFHGETPTALTLRVTYDPPSGKVVIASAMHAADESPKSLAVMASVSTERDGWWPVHNKIRDEVAVYSTCEEERTRLQEIPF